jgi:hypothetical protein
MVCIPVDGERTVENEDRRKGSLDLQDCLYYRRACDLGKDKRKHRERKGTSMKTYFIKESKTYNPYSTTTYTVCEWYAEHKVHFELTKNHLSVIPAVIEFLSLVYKGEESKLFVETDQQYKDIQNAVTFYDKHVKEVYISVIRP